MITIGKLENTPLGTIWAAADDAGLVAVSLWQDPQRFLTEVAQLTGEQADPKADSCLIVRLALTELDAYFRGELKEFTVPIDWSIMGAFQREALQRVYAVEYGHTTSYGAIAAQMGQPGAARGVGRANATNPIPIIIPCHRILGADGKLHGYSAPGGLETKAKLLRMEGSWLV